jgi:hypothetical protein
LVPALEVVRAADLVYANSRDSSSVLVDAALTNTIAQEHHKYAIANNGNFPNKDAPVLPPPYSGSHAGPSNQSKLEVIKNELQATPQQAP